jgi:KaiC/GvpD/RAD55 family RecA-like ATPase
MVRKMRRTKNDEDIHPLEVSEKGLIVHNLK